MADKQADAVTRSLAKECLALPYEERTVLCSAIHRSVIRERMERRLSGGDRGDVLLGYMGKILGGPVRLHSRETRYVWSRTMVAYQLVREGFSTIQAGRMLEKDHSTISYMCRRMEDVFSYPHAFKDIIDDWNQFQKLIRHDIH